MKGGFILKIVELKSTANKEALVKKLLKLDGVRDDIQAREMLANLPSKIAEVEDDRSAQFLKADFSALGAVVSKESLNEETIASKPQDIPLLPSGINVTDFPKYFIDIIKKALNTYKANFLKLVAIAAIVNVPNELVSPHLEESIMPIYRGSLIDLTLTMTFVILIQCTLYCLESGALIYAISEQNFRDINIGRAFRFSWGKLGIMVGATIIVVLFIMPIGIISVGVTMVMAKFMNIPKDINIVGIPIIAFGPIAVILYFSIRWFFILPSVLLEDQGARAALTKSSSLVKGDWWLVFVLPFFLIIIGLILDFLYGFVIGEIVGTLIEILCMVLISPLLSIVLFLLYFDLRRRKEGYSLELLSRELNIVAPEKEVENRI